jgi:hypothetical protein
MGSFLIEEKTHRYAPMRNVTIGIYEVAAGLNVADVITAFEIRTSTGYLATIPACPCERMPCLRTARRRKCDERLHCHGGYGKHVEHVRAMAGEVLKTYGSAKKGNSDPSQGRARLHDTYGYNGRVRNVSPREWNDGEWVKRMEVAA